MRQLALAACVLVVWGGLRSQVGAQTTAPDEAARELSPATLRLAAKHRLQFIRTPDGRFWDLWGEREYRRIFNRSVKKKEIKERRAAQGWATWITVGHRWEVNDSRDAHAWGISSTSEGMEFWRRSNRGTPPLWFCTRADDIPFIYINEEDRDVCTKDAELRATRVVAQLGEHVFRVGLDLGRGVESAKQSAPHRLEQGVAVWVEDPAVTNGGYLNGEFLLWPDRAIEVPGGFEGPKFRYCPLASLTPTAEEFLGALETGDAEMVTWVYKSSSGAFRWERQAFPLQYLERRKPDPEPEKPVREPAEPAPTITHILVLKSGDWVEGQLISENADEVRFLVVVGGIAGERVYPRPLVGRVVEK
ncbi:MAG: hypothetical protein IT431_03185 [Phycisphaerales bacterium]|nr:hypothetical protein [Phycisphaerales bacterium]